ncbi:TRAP transporter 4TM/12TM fusion protein [Caldalkalibacillus uzonensis]|nr:TRAP transporter permease [Caldalkalibacillus uzonensis]MDQ0340744.1 TRAP transporter 4TM/12TM fusion protein [Caldalkalibacillus uzonensis]
MVKPVLPNRGKKAEEELGLTEKCRDLNGWQGRLVSVIAVLMSLVHLYTAVFGIFESFMQRSMHLGFSLMLIFAVYRPWRNSNQEKIAWFDWMAIILSISVFAYFFVNGQDIVSRMSYIEKLTGLQIAIGLTACLLIIEATRRAVGHALTIIVILSLAYAVWGHHLPGVLSHREFTLMWVVDHLFYTTSGVFGIPLGVSATFIFMFVLFGKFLEISGAGQFFINLAVGLMGKYRGGPAKTAIIGSSLMGTISGSAVANTVTTGAFTIPLMKRTGYKKEFAGAVEAVSSSGGQIMPPIMGAAAFIIASYLGITYIEVAIAALIPAILYYLCLFVQVDLRAKRQGLQGLSKDQIPSVKTLLKTGFLFFIPLIVIVVMLVQGYSPMRAGLYAIVAIILVAMAKAVTRLKLKQMIEALDLGARAVLETAIACAAAGLVIGVITLTGLGLKFSSMIISLAGGSLLLTLIFTMLTSIILGMGLPTVAAYIVQVALTVPALIELGVTPIAAHLFVFYFAIISAITPPVALAAFAAAGIAGSEPMRTGMVALRLGIAAFIVPYMFVYGPSLLLVGDTVKIMVTVMTAIIGITGMAAAVEGWLVRQTLWYERLLLLAGSLTLIKPGLYTDTIGIFLLGVAYLLQKLTFKTKLNTSDNVAS